MTPGMEAAVVLPPHTKAVRLRLHRPEPDGCFTFVVPRNGGLRTVRPECVKRWYRDRQLVSAQERKGKQ